MTRNAARGRRTREPVQRQRHDALEPDEFLSLLEAASQLDNQPHTLARARDIRALRDDGMLWKDIAARLNIAPTTAIYLYACRESEHLRYQPSPGGDRHPRPRRSASQASCANETPRTST